MLTDDDPLARGRARIDRGNDGEVRIVIPAKREWPVLLFLLVWLAFWTFAGIDTIGALVNGGPDDGPQAFLVFWLCGWALGWAFVASVLVWSLIGREIVDIGSQTVDVTRAAGPYRRTKQFTRARIERVRTDAYEGMWRSMFDLRRSWRSSMEWWGIGGGSVVFDYGARTHRFGSKLDEAESRQLADLLIAELGLGDLAQSTLTAR